MGIPEFSKFLAAYNRGSERKIPVDVSGINIDLNSLLYFSLTVYGVKEAEDSKKLATIVKKLETPEGKTELQDAYFRQVWDNILKLVKLFNPENYLHIAADGVAPVAKISQQRSRRYRLQLQEPKTFNTLKLTAGTQFMRDLDKYIREKLETHQADLAPKIYYSSHMVPGEGEHKILDFFREGKATGNKNHIVIGNDNDYIPLLMGLKLPHIVIYNQEFEKVYYIDYIRGQMLIELGVIDFSGSIKAGYDQNRVIDDIVLMTIMIGNDFLPPMPGLNSLPKSLNTLFEVYKLQLPDKRYLTRNGELVNKNFKRFTEKLKDYEDQLLGSLKLNMQMKPIPEVTKAVTVIDAEGSKFEVNQKLFNRSWWEKFTPLELDGKEVPDIVRELYKDLKINPKNNVLQTYYNSIKWILGYYLKGTYTINLNWYYPYYWPPTISSFAEYLENPEDMNWDVPEYSFSVIHQLLVVIPPKYENFIPKPVRGLISGNLGDIAPIDFIFEDAGTIYKDQVIPLIPIINPYRILYEVSKIKLDEDVIAKYSAASELVLTPTIIKSYTHRMEQLKAELRKKRSEAKREIAGKIGGGSDFIPAPRGRGRGERGGRRGRGFRGRGKTTP